MNNHDIDQLIHQIYFHAQEQSPDEFINWGFNFLRKYIDFDSSIWLAASYSHPLKVHAIHYYGEVGPEMMENYEYVKHDDFLHRTLLQNTNKILRTYDVLPRQELEKRTIYNEHCKLFGMEDTICMAVPLRGVNIGGILSLYSYKKDIYETSRFIAERLIPTLFYAYQLSQNHNLYRQALAANDPAEFVYAVCDKHGLIHHAMPGFVKVIQLNWPSWVGPVIPQELCPALLIDGETCSYESKIIVAQGQPYQGMFKIAVRESKPEDSLSLREREVYDLRQQKLSYKEIAKVLGISHFTVTKHINRINAKLINQNT